MAGTWIQMTTLSKNCCRWWFLVALLPYLSGDKVNESKNDSGILSLISNLRDNLKTVKSL